MMKPIFKRSASLLLAVCMLLMLLPTAVYAGEGATPSGGPDWVLSGEGKLTINNDEGMAGWRTVVEDVYNDIDNVLSVEIGEAVTTIGYEAFQYCSALEEVTFPGTSQLTEIGESAFASTGLTDVNIPASVTTIGFGAFQSCSALKVVTFPGTSLLTEIDAFAFASTGLEAVEIPASVTIINNGAFQDCGALEEVTFEGASRLKEIHSYAFASTGFTAVNIPASVTTIGYQAFQYCSALEEVTFAGTSRLTEIHSYAFASTGLTSFTIPASVTSIDGGVFAACESLGAIGVEPGSNSYVAVDGVLYGLGYNGPNVLVAYPAGRDGVAFTIPGGIIQIGASAFQGSKLTSVTIPPTVTDIGISAFSDSDLLEEVTFQRSMTLSNMGLSIDSGIFQDCAFFVDPTLDNPRIHVPVGAKEAYVYAFALNSNDEVKSDFIHEPVELNEITNEFTDVKFRAAVRFYLGKGNNNPIYEADVRFLESLDVSSGDNMGDIQSLEGISWFSNLKKLDCSGNELTALDFSSLTGLTELNCAGNELTALDLSGLTGLTELDCGGNELTALDLSGLNGLTELYCSGNKLTNLNLPAGLKVLDCSYNGLTALPALPAGLTELYCADNKLTNLNLPSGLEVLYCSYNELTALPALPSGLTELYCSGNKLTNLNLPSGLKVLDCSYNKLTTLNLSGLTGLTQLNYAGTGLTGLNLSGLTHLKVLLCYDNGLTVLPALPAGLTALDCSDNKLTGLDLSGLTHLKVLDCSVNMLTTLDVNSLTGLENLDCSVNKLITLDVTYNTELESLDCRNNYMADASALVGYNEMTYLYFNPQDDPGFIRVTGITGLPTAASVGTPLTLTGTVVPGDAQNRDIDWGFSESGDGGTGAEIDGNIFTATHAGTVWVQASIHEGLGAERGYYQSFEITVSAAGVTPTAYTVAVTNGTGSGSYVANAAVSIAANPAPSGWRFKEWSITPAVTFMEGTATSQTAKFAMPAQTVAATAIYEPIPADVTSVTVHPTQVTVQIGAGYQFSATVAGENNPAQSVTWSVSGNSSAGTVINAGLLTVGADETAEELTVTAQSTVDTGKSGTAAVTVSVDAPPEATVTSVTVTPGTITLARGGSHTFSAMVTGVNNPSPSVTWAVYDNNSAGTAITAGGLLTVAAGETAHALTIRATSTVDTGKSGTAAITVIQPAAQYAVTVNGSYASQSGAGSYPQGAAVTVRAGSRSNYTFAGWTSPDGVSFANAGSATTTFAMPDKNVTVTANWSYNGGSGDTGGSTPVPSSTPTPTPAPAQHHAAITGGGMSEASLTVEVDAAAGNASINLEALASELFTRDEAAVIRIPAIDGVNSYTLGVPAGTLSQGPEKGALTLETRLGSITLAANMLTGMEQAQGKAAAITISEGDKDLLSEDVKAAVGHRPLVQLTLTLDGERAAWNNPDAPVTVSIPYTPVAQELLNPESIVIWYIDGSGAAVCVPNGRYDPATGTVTFTTTHFSYYAVAYNKVSFGDVAGNAWYGKAVAFIAARGITSGTGGGNYSPNARLTRAELIVLLMNAYGIAPDKNPADNFSDAGNTWYTGHLAAAKRLGISDGVGNNRFAPDREITRQEMFTLMYNVLKVYGKLPETGDGKTLSEFGDAGDVALWAKDATELFVETGIIEGVDGKLFPADTTTRAEIAQVLYNLLSK